MPDKVKKWLSHGAVFRDGSRENPFYILIIIIVVVFVSLFTCGLTACAVIMHRQAYVDDLRVTSGITQNRPHILLNPLILVHQNRVRKMGTTGIDQHNS